ncbi:MULTISPECIES: DUF3857 domain-containing protein [Flavobacterium]|uniref:DUF3857 domain-containing protein n=1 Tax=Flavobacterium cupriresistens TaxID=2893885 RepID=A0ABU4RFI0_9FLAO|nr:MULTISPECIES: DUF3857 domain-containing protein [unclassified Flavobacterium]KLT68053.1 transglutaminase [Flavobacterium sp. ABG]MDX6191357.1 DUF3857 domain-containing protein [Flavobacterium sp. Fl-318]UFH43124.1 DUF3857 and transglutaminase domain-containing protein [Flavobacterium sp. F-323]
MKINQLPIIVFAFFFSLLKLTAQEFKLGKVSIAELEQKVHPKDTAASAAVLYKKGKTSIEYDQTDGFVTLTEVETRIKIYKKEGYDLANKEVWYYSASNSREKVLFSEAATFNLVAGKIEKTKLKSDGSFDEIINKYRSRKKITMPNVKEGSVIEFKYTIRSPFREIRDWDFQMGIPVNYSEFTSYVPEYYVFNVRQKGYVFPKVTTDKNTKSITFLNKGGSGGSGYSNSQHNYFETKTNYIAENLPAMREEAYVNNIDNYTSSVQFELSMVQFPNEPMKAYSTDWNSVVKTIYNYDDFGPELNKTGYFEDDLKVVLDGKVTSEDRIMAILNYVKSSVKWNDYLGYSCDSGVKKAYKEKTGNIADINLMLTAMLRHSGLNANPVLVSTRSNGISLFPNRTAFNYVIAAVETPNGTILLDATSKYASPNILPFRVLNWQGRLIRKDGTSESIDLVPKKPSGDNVFMNYEIDAEGKVTGKVRRQCTDYNAMSYRNEIDGVKEDVYLEKLENENNKIEINDYSRTNEKEILLPAIETYSFKGDNLAEVIGGKIYINPMLFYTNTENSFKQETREYPVDFGFPFADKFNITIKLPEGFAVETLPAPAAIAMEDNLGTFKFNIAENSGVLQLSILHQINEAVVTPEKYEMLKEYYKAMIAKETEKVVLKRI